MKFTEGMIERIQNKGMQEPESLITENTHFGLSQIDEQTENDEQSTVNRSMKSSQLNNLTAVDTNNEIDSSNMEM